MTLALGKGSPRSVGSALRNNPFAPYIPCHRVIASNMFLGGFMGEWTKERQGTQKRKLELLEGEGVRFDQKGVLVKDDGVLWVREE